VVWCFLRINNLISTRSGAVGSVTQQSRRSQSLGSI
jgi:hypothetical protein